MVLINDLMGAFGIYHFGLCFMIFLSKFGVAFHQMAIIFLAPPTQYRCPDTNNSCCDKPIFDKNVFRTIVSEWNLTCQNSWLKDFTQTLFQFGVLLGSFLFGIASDKYGRKPTLVIAAVLKIFSGIMSSFMPEYWSFTIIRMILGFAVGGVNVVGFVVLMEFVGVAYRDLIAALYHVPFSLGHMFLALIGYYIRDFMYFQLTISSTTLVLLIFICFLPESPRWLLAKKRTFEACKLMERVAKRNHLPVENFEQQLVQYQLQTVQERQRKGSFIDLFRKPHIRKNIFVMGFVWMVCSYCFYGMSHYISHLTGDMFINVMACGSVCLCGCFLSILILKFMKRKTTIIVESILTAVCVLIIAVIPEGKGSVVLGCFGVFFSYMTFILLYLYSSEMFPTTLRNAALGLSSMMARLGSMIAPFVAGLRPHGQWCAPLAFGIFPLVAAGLCLLLPETKDCELPMTVEEVEQLEEHPEDRQSNHVPILKSIF